jgi:secondary thiamine-phosphate synthase enzyme
MKTTLTVSTVQREAFIDITEQVNESLRAVRQETGTCLVFCPHTTAGITINECADPAVVLDMKQALGDLVADGSHWRHLEGNSPAHVKASLMGSSAIVPVVDGELRLGRWQGVFLCEFDGPRTREVWVQILS